MSLDDDPIADDDLRRGSELGDYLMGMKWTVGQAKRAMAVWYEGVMATGTDALPTAEAVKVLLSDLQDFMGVVGQLRGMRDAVELQRKKKIGWGPVAG